MQREPNRATKDGACAATDATDEEKIAPVASDGVLVDSRRCAQSLVFRRLGYTEMGGRQVVHLCDDDGSECRTIEWTWGPTEGN